MISNGFDKGKEKRIKSFWNHKEGEVWNTLLQNKVFAF